MDNFEKLIVWQKTHQLTILIYSITKFFPSDEKFGITSQLRRAASSVPANIVEGTKRNGKKDKVHFLNVAEASLEETKYFIILANDLGYIKNNDRDKLHGLAKEASAMIRALINAYNKGFAK